MPSIPNSVIRSVQIGTRSNAGTITISAVNTAKTFVYATFGGGGNYGACGTVTLTDSTTVTIASTGQSGGGGVPSVVQVVEFY